MSNRSKNLDAVFRDATDPIIIENLDGIVLSLNNEAVRTYGFARDELVGRTIKEIVPRERHDQADDLLRRCRAGEALRSIEGLRVTKDGRQLPVLLSLSLLSRDDGEPVAIASFAKDISLLRQSEAETKRLSRVFMDAADPIVIEDLSGNVIDLNREAQRAYGWQREQLIGQPIKRIVPEHRYGQADELLQRCLAGEEVRNIEGLRVSRTGEIFDVLITLSLLMDEYAEPMGVASIAKDITSLRQAEAELKSLNRDLEKKVEQRTSELASANKRLRHELAVARELSDTEHRKHEESLLGDSIPVRALREGIAFFAKTDEPLVLSGPSGAGQEAVARSIHRGSSRCERPFIYVDCAHIAGANESTFGFRVDSENNDQLGKASLADGGSLYLESVETLSPNSQQQLLAFLTDSAAQRAVGATSHPDVRVIASISQRPESDSSPGRLRDELEQKLAQHRLAVPSLAERKADITVIADHILDRCARSSGKALEGLSTDAKEMLQRYSWPGNIRELRSVVERAVLLASGTHVEIPEELLREGRRVGGYTLQRQLGQGGMGEVWLAQHSLLARPSAVKLIRQSAMQQDAGARQKLEERFQREAKATAQLRSPNTVELYDFGMTDDGDFFYVMEYLQGVDLTQLVSQFGALDPARAVYFLKQACASLSEAHLMGLVHRDLKPDNLFACRLGTQYDFLKVLDFGIVHMSSGEDQTGTLAGALTGSPATMSPEAAQGEDVTFASDVYSLGCVAYWLLTGRQVFEAPSVMQLLLQHLSRQPQRPSDFRPGLPNELEKLVLRCLAKEPSDRPSDAFELGKQLAALPLEQCWDTEQAQQWWNANLPCGEKAGSQSDTSVAIDSETRSSREAEPISETTERKADVDRTLD